MNLNIGPAFQPYLEEAVERFSYLYPNVAVDALSDQVTLSTTDLEVVAAFRHTLYRQRIHRETEGLRRLMIEGLVG